MSARRTPRQNHLLAALPLQDYELLLPDLEPVPLPLGWTVHRAGDREKHLYFLTAGIVSVTQELIAEMLGVRRVGVTVAVGHLQGAGLVHCGRGHIAVLDRPRLEARVCERYAIVRRAYERLVPGCRRAEEVA